MTDLPEIETLDSLEARAEAAERERDALRERVQELEAELAELSDSSVPTNHLAIVVTLL